MLKNVPSMLSQLLAPDLACDKGCLKLLATCNCLPHAGKEISAEGQVLNGISSQEATSTGDMGIDT